MKYSFSEGKSICLYCECPLFESLISIGDCVNLNMMTVVHKTQIDLERLERQLGTALDIEIVRKACKTCPRRL